MDALTVFRMVATEFRDTPADDVTDDKGVTTYGVNSYMEIAKTMISKKRFGNAYDQALAYLTAHRMKMAGLGSNEYGTVADNVHMSSFSEGESSISFSSSQVTNLEVDGELSLTSYGLQYLTIRRTMVVPILSSGED